MITEVKSKKVPEGFDRVVKDYDEFVWESSKADKVKKKHKISFDLATYIFSGVRIERPDYGDGHFDDRDEGERIYTIGRAKNSKGNVVYYVVIFIEISDTRIKLISARYAEADERRWYLEYC